MNGKEIHAKVLQLAMYYKEVEDLTDVFKFIEAKKNLAKNTIAKLEDELKSEMESQYKADGVVSIHPAIKMRSKTLRDFSDTTIKDASDKKYIVINQSEMDSVIEILMDRDDADELLSVDTKSLGKLAKAKIPEWAKYSEEQTRIPSVGKKLGEYLIDPLAVFEEKDDVEE
jgi:hypothetical protein